MNIPMNAPSDNSRPILLSAIGSVIRMESNKKPAIKSDGLNSLLPQKRNSSPVIPKKIAARISMATPQAIKRLKKEYAAIMKNPVPFIVAKPSEKNILEW
ncbi:hypothetical protein O9G_001500 [Rozella allomycis CSF55]|uniref:UBC core domain-containing protein n=1 Tax=Rozella allomycis (strain CSF55) TaxID=988480 RepID=A0A075AMV1_ROZAC|nr:hypothetical protein O9G_001500 [Rozella allomycis CSF55]|eukprot:EPZ31026.1 hypothetical protein O9G_001500 [Rozella allomycis CSF55]